MLVQAWRSWRTTRAVALVAAAALAAGIGSATAIYTLANAVMLKPLPYRDADRFVALFSGDIYDPKQLSSLSASDARTYQDRTQAFDAFGWFRESGQNLMFAGEPHHVRGLRVTTSLAHHLGVAPVMGQWFQDETGVVLSGSLWRRLGEDPEIVGRPITLDGRSYTITGVMPEWFRLPVAGVGSVGVRIDLWIALDPAEEAGGVYVAYARRKPGIRFEAAAQDVKRVATQIATEGGQQRAAYTGQLVDLRETMVRQIRPTLLLLLGAAGLLFLIACANAAGLLLTRAVGRARETALRVALGAGRVQLAALNFTETLPIALGGALGGMLLSIAVTPAIVALTTVYLPRPEDVSVDWRVLLFAATAALAATALASLAPLWHALRTPPASALADSARATAGRRSRRLSQSLIVGEVALAFALLVVSAILLGHLRTLSRTSPGFDADDLLTFVVSVPGRIAGDSGIRLAFQRRLLDEIGAIPGVDEVAFAGELPLEGCCFGTNIYPDERNPDLLASQRNMLMAVSPSYLSVMRIPLRRGRWLTDRDLADDLAFAVISETAARRYWGDQDPVGAYGRFNNPQGARFEVVGVVGDVKNDGLGKPSVPDIYILANLRRLETMHFVVRSTRAPATLVSEIRQAVLRVDPEQPIHAVATMREIMERSMTLERAASFLTVFFAGAALLVAMLGVYGVVAYGARQATVEIGTRMALGARTGDVLFLIVGRGVWLAALGVLAGGVVSIAGVAALDRVFTMDYGVAPFVYSTSIVGSLALVASFVPAWRASLLSPLVAIRNEPASMWQAIRREARRGRGDLEDAGSGAATLGPLIGEIADSVRRVASFPEAIAVALQALRDRVGAQSIALLERTGSDQYAGSGLSLPAGGFLMNRLSEYPHPLSMTSADLEAWLRWAAERRAEYLAEIGTLMESNVRMAVPLRTKKEVVGVLLLGPPVERERYAESTKVTLGSAADVFALMVENARLTERALEQERLRRDLALAAEVQRNLLPTEPPQARDLSLAAVTLPARAVGGDYYDFIDLGGERIGIAVADVSGKGVAAALVMSVVQASLRIITAQRDAPLSELATTMNRFLYRSTGANKYATFFYAQLDCARRLQYVNAGHNPPYLVRAGADGVEIVELATGGMVLGLFPETEYEDGEIELRPGDLLMAFTDGVTEALNPDGEEFGDERLKAFLRGSAGASTSTIAARLAETMRDWIAGGEQHDDLTFVLAGVGPAPETSWKQVTARRPAHADELAMRGIDMA